MIERFFDAVLLGGRPCSTLACAALLARRDFRVLVLGDGARPATYHYDGIPLRRRTFSPFFFPRPPFRRVLAELAQSQVLRRRLVPLEPSMQVIDGRRRLSISADADALSRELARLPTLGPAIEALYVRMGEIDAALDPVLAEDALWPPSTFWERRETNRLARMLPTPESLPLDAEYRRVVESTSRFLTHESAHDGPLSPLVLARLHRGLVTDPSYLPGDEDELSSFLCDRIRAHGGEVWLDEGCAGIVHKRGKVAGIIVDGTDETIACNFVIGERPGHRLVERVRDVDFELDPRAIRAGGAHERRFVVSIVVRRALVPAALGRHAVLFPVRPHDPEVHLTRATFATEPASLADAELWVAEALMADAAYVPSRVGEMPGRERVLSTLRSHLPFLDAHTLVVDSPHDGGPILDGREGGLRAIPRAEVRATGGRREAEVAEPLYGLPAEAYAGLGGEPIRTPVEGLLTIAPTVMPPLGPEGELVAAWGAARIVTRTDPKRERMRRELWSKIEL